MALRLLKCMPRSGVCRFQPRIHPLEALRIVTDNNNCELLMKHKNCSSVFTIRLFK